MITNLEEEPDELLKRESIIDRKRENKIRVASGNQVQEFEDEKTEIVRKVTKIGEERDLLV